jgi:hypothetical protein
MSLPVLKSTPARTIAQSYTFYIVHAEAVNPNAGNCNQGDNGRLHSVADSTYEDFSFFDHLRRVVQIFLSGQIPKIPLFHPKRTRLPLRHRHT